MFVRHSVAVDQPFEAVAPRFVRDPSWLEPIVASAIGASSVQCRRGVARTRAHTLVVPLAWRVPPSSLPSLEGDLAIEPVSPSTSRMTFEATYDPGPQAWWVAADAVDHAVHAFLAALAEVLLLESPA